MTDPMISHPAGATPLVTARAVTLPELVDVLRGQHAAKLDVVTTAASLHAAGGVVHVADADHALTVDGVGRLPCRRGEGVAPVPHRVRWVRGGVGGCGSGALRGLPCHLRLDRSVRRPPRGRGLPAATGARSGRDQERDLAGASLDTPCGRLIHDGRALPPAHRSACRRRRVDRLG